MWWYCVNECACGAYKSKSSSFCSKCCADWDAFNDMMDHHYHKYAL